jgi:hypothetical protein
MTRLEAPPFWKEPNTSPEEKLVPKVLFTASRIRVVQPLLPAPGFHYRLGTCRMDWQDSADPIQNHR